MQAHKRCCICAHDYVGAEVENVMHILMHAELIQNDHPSYH